MQVWDRKQSVVAIVGALALFVILCLILISLKIRREFLALAFLAPVLFYFLNMRRYFLRRSWTAKAFPEDWRNILEKHVEFYCRLPESEKRRFEQDIRIFLGENRITPVDTTIDDTIRLLVASSAVILTFGHPEWEYRKLPEILIYPRSFDSDYSTTSHPKERSLAGIIVPQNAIVLAKDELLRAFREPSEGYHVGLHEFAHALDLADGYAEGIPVDLDSQTVQEWNELMREELRKVRLRRSLLSPYAGKNKGELFAVAVEYFFQRPAELRQQHEKLYRALSAFFNQDPADRHAASDS